MSKSMRLFVRFVATVLILAIAAPFYLTGPGGRPLLSLDRVTRHIPLPSAFKAVWEEPAPEGADMLRIAGVAVYRWQDQHGIWQFGEEVPEGVAAEAVNVQSRITPLGSDWQVEDPEDESAGSTAPALAGNPLGGTPLGGTPLGGNPLGGNPLGGNPLGGNPLGGNPLEAYAQAPDLMRKAKQVADQIQSRNAALKALTP